jgi:hypothetical protein
MEGLSARPRDEGKPTAVSRDVRRTLADLWAFYAFAISANAKSA